MFFDARQRRPHTYCSSHIFLSSSSSSSGGGGGGGGGNGSGSGSGSGSSSSSSNNNFIPDRIQSRDTINEGQNIWVTL